MTKWVLIVFLSSSDGSAVEMHDFFTENGCRSAAAVFAQKGSHRGYYTARCIRDGEGS